MSGVHPRAGAPAAFLPLTLSEIGARPGEGGRPELGPLADRALAAERAAEDSWHALLGDCACARRGQFPDHLRLLSEAAGEYAGDDWWRGQGSRYRARVAEFEHWVAEALDEGDGEEFAGACAAYDAALAQAMATARGRAGAASGTITG
jgi:hypothetical protein